MISKAQELRRKRAGLVEKAREILTQAQEAGRDNLNAEEDEKYNRIMADVESLRVTIERLEEQADLEADLRTIPEPFSVGGGNAPRKSSVSETLRNWMRTGFLNGEKVDKLESRDLTVGTASAGGNTVPEDSRFFSSIEDALKQFGGMRQVSEIIPTDSGNDLPVPTANDTSNTGELVAEAGAHTLDVDPSFGQVVLKAYKYGSKVVQVSVELLQDAGFPLEQWLGEKLGERIGRITNTHFTTGTGTSQPKGVVTGATLGKTGTTGQTTTVIYADLVDLIHSVDAAYRNGARFMFRDSTLAAIKKLLDSQNRPLWVPGLASREPDTILGFPYTINSDVAAMAANAKSILFGDFRKYKIRQVRGYSLVRLNELYAINGLVGFLAFARFDGNLIDAGTNPIKYYANSAT